MSEMLGVEHPHNENPQRFPAGGSLNCRQTTGSEVALNAEVDRGRAEVAVGICRVRQRESRRRRSGVIRPHAPEEYEACPEDDRNWDWKAGPDVRDAISPAIAREARTAAFLAEQAILLTPYAANIFVDAASDSLLDAFMRLESIARGNYAADDSLAAFPPFEEAALPSPPRIGVKALFEAWAKGTQPATSTVDRWSAVFNSADKHFPDAFDIDLPPQKRG